MKTFKDLGADTLAPGIAADSDLLRHIGRFHRLTVVTDQHWPALLMPQIQS